MFVMAILVLAAGPAEAAGRQQELQGGCHYNAAVQAHRDDTVLVPCDAVSIDHSADAAGIVFSQHRWDVVMIRFQGAWAGDHMTVRHLALRNGMRGAAKGTCEVFRREGRVSAVSCLATMAGRAYSANFETSRIGN